jgi:hypothetical protein
MKAFGKKVIGMNDLPAWINKLNSMTSTEIAELMRIEGVKATPGDGCICAMTMFLEIKTGLVLITSDRYVTNCNGNKKYQFDQGPIEFIFNFDDCKYPDLIKR